MVSHVHVHSSWCVPHLPVPSKLQTSLQEWIGIPRLTHIMPVTSLSLLWTFPSYRQLLVPYCPEKGGLSVLGKEVGLPCMITATMYVIIITILIIGLLITTLSRICRFLRVACPFRDVTMLSSYHPMLALRVPKLNLNPNLVQYL